MRHVICVVLLALLLTCGSRAFTLRWAKIEHEIYLAIHDAMREIQ